MGSQWDWQVFWQDTGGDQTYGQWLLSAWGWTLSLSLLALGVALGVGVLIGILRTLPSRPLAWIGHAWVELFRNIPLLVQVFLWYYVVPELIPSLKPLPTFWWMVFALGFFTSARVAEQVMAGLQALPPGQRQAALALGLTLPQTYRHVLLPRALRIVIPPLTSEAMNIVKNSSVAFAISVAELTMFARQAGEETSRNVEIYLAVTGLYAVSAFAINRIAWFIERRMQVPGLVGAPR